MPRNKKKGIGFFDLMLGAPFPQVRSQERQQQAAQAPYYYYPSPQEQQQQQQPVYTYTIPENNSNPPPQKEKKVRFADNLVQYSDEEPKGYASSTAAQDSEPDSGFVPPTPSSIFIFNLFHIFLVYLIILTSLEGRTYLSRSNGHPVENTR